MLWGAAQRAGTTSSWLARSPARRSSCGRGSSAVPSNRTRVAAATRTTEEASWSRGIGVVYGVSCVGVCFPPALRRPLLLSPSRSAPAGRAARDRDDRDREIPQRSLDLRGSTRARLLLVVVAARAAGRRCRGGAHRFRQASYCPSIGFVSTASAQRVTSETHATSTRCITPAVGVITPLNHSSPWGTACEG